VYLIGCDGENPVELIYQIIESWPLVLVVIPALAHHHVAKIIEIFFSVLKIVQIMFLATSSANVQQQKLFTNCKLMICYNFLAYYIYKMIFHAKFWSSGKIYKINLHFHGAAWWLLHSVSTPEQLEEFLDARHAGVWSATKGHDLPQKHAVRPAAAN
jgi:hypothetical protein